MKDVARAYRFSILEEPVSPKELIPKADRIGYFVGILVFATTLCLYITPEIINLGTEQTVIGTCWIPKDAAVTTDEEAWQNQIDEMKKSLHQTNLLYDNYKILLGDDANQFVLLTKNDMYYMAKIGKTIFMSNKGLLHPKSGIIQQVSYSGVNQIQWEVQYSVWSLLWSAAEGIFFGLIYGFVSFWLSGFVFYLITLKFSSLRARYEAT